MLPNSNINCAPRSRSNVQYETKQFWRAIFDPQLAHQICHMISGLKLFETSYDEIPRAKLRVDHSSTVLWAAQDQRPYIERCASWALVKVW